MPKQLLSGVAIGLTFALFLPYIPSILHGRTRPHVFSSVVWGLGTSLSSSHKLAGHAGWGAWPIGISGTISCYIAVLAYRNSQDTAITRLDWVFLVAALSALPCWFLTSDPLWAVVILTVDLVGFGPTFRKGYSHPHDESVVFFSLSIVRNILVILATEHYSVTTFLGH